MRQAIRVIWQCIRREEEFTCGLAQRTALDHVERNGGKDYDDGPIFAGKSSHRYKKSRIGRSGCLTSCGRYRADVWLVRGVVLESKVAFELNFLTARLSAWTSNSMCSIVLFRPARDTANVFSNPCGIEAVTFTLNGLLLLFVCQRFMVAQLELQHIDVCLRCIVMFLLS